MYIIVSWEDDSKVFGQSESLSSAKRKCKALGHTDEYNEGTDRYAPVAFVGEYRLMFGGNEQLCCVYNPRFYKHMSARIAKVWRTGGNRRGL